tara:strand:+ start:320 stop:661 length:342 start_codon:yes stop_codon:yes gene_type:complete
MNLYPQHYLGFEVDSSVAERLELIEAFDIYELSHDEEQFFDKFEEKYGVYPYTFTDTTVGPGSYIQSLRGFKQNSTYICFHPATAGDDRWENMILLLQKADVCIQEGKWSELG